MSPILIFSQPLFPPHSFLSLSTRLPRSAAWQQQSSANVPCSGKTEQKRRRRREARSRKTQWHSEILGQTIWDWKSLPRAQSEASLVPAVAKEENWCADSQIVLMVVQNSIDLLSDAVLPMFRHTSHIVRVINLFLLILCVLIWFKHLIAG